MSVVALIPARGGSRRVPGKNLAPCAGRPLLAWSAEAALGARSLDRVILSTDDARIAEAGRALGLEVPFVRPSALAAEAAPMVPVMRHALDWVEAEEPGAVEALVLLQPTSPLRRARDIDEAVALFRDSGADTVVSVVALAHIYHPARLHRLDASGVLRPFMPGAETMADEPAYARNGPAILINRPAVVRSGEKFGARMVGYVMPAEASVDVDDPVDLALADVLLRRRAAEAAAAS